MKGKKVFVLWGIKTRNALEVVNEHSTTKLHGVCSQEPPEDLVSPTNLQLNHNFCQKYGCRHQCPPWSPVCRSCLDHYIPSEEKKKWDKDPNAKEKYLAKFHYKCEALKYCPACKVWVLRDGDAAFLIYRDK